MDYVGGLQVDVDGTANRNVYFVGRSVQLLEYFGAKRAKHARKLRNTIKKCDPSLRSDLSKLAKVVAKQHNPDGRNGRATTVDQHAACAVVQLGIELHSLRRLDQRSLHLSRRKIKELRYMLQFTAASPDYRFLAILGKVKDVIGEWHDWEELVAIAKDLIGSKPQCKLLRQLKANARTKFEEALRVTNEMRSTYMNGGAKAKGVRDAGRLPMMIGRLTT
jgi:CHAD domain-containing protein